MDTADKPLNPALEPLAFLIGVWRGEGRGFYPTIEDFTYSEESRFWSSGRAVLHYEQRTSRPGDGAPLHCESGYLRLEGGRVELILAHPLGIIEIEEGTLDGTRLELASTSVAVSSTAIPVQRLARVLEVDGDRLTYRLSMEAVGQPLGAHLEAELTRV